MNEISKFDYGQLDTSTSDFLKRKENNMREIVGKAYTDLGRELKEAQDNLSNHDKYKGVFEKWYTSFGFKKVTVYNLINRYDLVQNLNDIDRRELIEELPVSLSYEIAKPSADEELKKKVLDGEVKTLKEYKQLEKRLKEEEENRKKAESEYEQIRSALESMNEDQSQFIRKVDEDEQRKFYTDFIEELAFIRSKYGAVSLEGSKLRLAVQQDSELCQKLDDFDDFWMSFSKSIYKDQTIIEMG